MHVIAHGGAGSPPNDPLPRQHTLEEAVDDGLTGEEPLTAICRTINALESDPAFNAGVGSAVQSDGRIRTDAGLMVDDGRSGAVASLEGVEHAIDVARAVLEDTPHVMLAGEAAMDFAAAMGIETDVDLWSDRTRDRWNEMGQPGPTTTAQLVWLREHFAGHDTVGAVATDGNRVAAGTSTGGRWAALAGRVGDVPQIGAGFYASDSGGASATGAGEDIAKEALARLAVGLLDDGHSPGTAAALAIEHFEERVDGSAGVIVMDPDGNAGSAFNSAAMQTAGASKG